TKSATFTVLHNGILVHHGAEVRGDAIECTISLQDHSNPVRYRNIWVRPLKDYDSEK
ncbi:MAG: family 16 glycoside hydrolase, partial [Verrucomicrobiota bacterium]